MIPQEAQNLQRNAVASLVEKTAEQNTLFFKAPTGSGKTYMMADMMNRILAEDENVVFLVATLSKGQLAEQNYNAFVSYKADGRFTHLDPYLINTETASEEGVFIPTDHNVFVLARDLYKQKSKLMQGPMELWLQTVTGNLFTSSLGKKIYLIKDECHQEMRNLDNLSKQYFSKVYNFSATPEQALKREGRGRKPDVEITEEDAEAAHLIKRVVYGGEEESLDVALEKYLEIKHDYLESLGVNPCLIIQISNKEQAEKQWNEIIEPALKKHDITYMYIVDKDKDCKTNSIYASKPVSFWRKEAKLPTSPVEVVVFKLAISEGWDIPRANMLYQIRDTKSKQLDEQVLGRVRRNPILTSFDNYSAEAQELALRAWVWGTERKDGAETIAVKLASPASTQQELKVKTTVLSEISTNNENFDVSEHISRERKVISKSIFELWHDWEATSADVRSLCGNHTKSYRDWLDVADSIKEIARAYRDAICDYDKTMSVLADEENRPILVTVPQTSYFIRGKDSSEVIISDSIWRRLDDGNTFFFDSKAEGDFATILKNMAVELVKKDAGTLDTVYLWGKNYPAADIRYAYYSGGVHFSYPDFILKDKHDRIHIFEVKSVNEGGRFSSDVAEDYLEKINELKKAYLHASKLTEHYFYLPIKRQGAWQIYQYANGSEQMVTEEQLRSFLRS